MSRFIRVVVFGLIAAMVLVALGVTAWRWDAYLLEGAFSSRKLVVTTIVLVFIPLCLGFCALAINAMCTRGAMAEDTRRVSENSLIAAALIATGVQLWCAATAILGEPPAREFGARMVEAITGIYFIVTANFSAKTSPPQGWPEPGRWTRATLRTGWVGVVAGMVILAGAIAAPVESMVWVVGGASIVYVLAAVLNHVGVRRKAA